MIDTVYHLVVNNNEEGGGGGGLLTFFLWKGRAYLRGGLNKGYTVILRNDAITVSPP